MQKKYLLTHMFFILVASILFNSKSFAEPPNLGLVKARLVRYHDSGHYLRDIEAIADKATKYIELQAANNEHLTAPKKLAIVLDIDETSLSNYDNMKANDFSSSAEQITQQLMAANEPAIQPILNLYQDALQHHVAVFFVTGRDQSLSQATTQNLTAAGYASWSGLEFRTQPSPTIDYKTAARAKITEQGYTIIASIGDQDSDLIGGYAQRTFKLPNPYYYLP